MALPDVQTKQVLANLVVDKCLRDIAPGRGGTTDEKVDKEKQHHSCVGERERQERGGRERERQERGGRGREKQERGGRGRERQERGGRGREREGGKREVCMMN